MSCRLIWRSLECYTTFLFRHTLKKQTANITGPFNGYVPINVTRNLLPGAFTSSSNNSMYSVTGQPGNGCSRSLASPYLLQTFNWATAIVSLELSAPYLFSRNDPVLLTKVCDNGNRYFHLLYSNTKLWKSKRGFRHWFFRKHTQV